MDLCRRILLEVETNPPDESIETLSLVGEYSHKTVLEHVALLQDAGLLEAEIIAMSGGAIYYIKRLTWLGHDFLDAARDDGLWGQATERIEAAGVSVTFSLLREILEDLARRAIGLS